MTYVPPVYTDEEIIADMEVKAAYWEERARVLSQADDLKAADAAHIAHCHSALAFYCLDYSKHLRPLAECMRLDVLDRDIESPSWRL